MSFLLEATKNALMPVKSEVRPYLVTVLTVLSVSIETWPQLFILGLNMSRNTFR